MVRQDSSPRVAYICSRFPVVRETFVLLEILELERLGFDPRLYPLLRGRQAVEHSEVRRLDGRLRHSPLTSPRLWLDNLAMLLTRPRRYLTTARDVFRGVAPSRWFLTRALAAFPKAVHMGRRMRLEGVAHIHAHFCTHPALAAYIIHRIEGLPYSFTAHGSDLHKDQTFLDEKLRRAAFVVMISQYNCDFLAERVGEWVRERLRLVRCGVDLERFHPPERRPREPGRPLRIVCVAALEEVKGHRHLLEACRHLAGRGTAFELRLVGDGDLRPDLEGQACEAGIAEQVAFLGFRDREAVLEELAEADAAVLASVRTASGRREGIPVSLMEAQAMALPVVSSRQSGIPELVADGETGLLVAPGDAEALAEALERLAGDPELCLKMGRAGREKVRREYDQRRNVAALAELFRAGPAQGVAGGKVQQV